MQREKCLKGEGGGLGWEAGTTRICLVRVSWSLVGISSSCQGGSPEQNMLVADRVSIASTDLERMTTYRADKALVLHQYREK